MEEDWWMYIFLRLGKYFSQVGEKTTKGHMVQFCYSVYGGLVA